VCVCVCVCVIECNWVQDEHCTSTMSRQKVVRIRKSERKKERTNEKKPHPVTIARTIMEVVGKIYACFRVLSLRGEVRIYRL